MKKHFAKITLTLGMLCSLLLHGQSDQSDSILTTLSLESSADVFYAYDFNRPDTTSRLPFLVNHNRHNEFNVNLVTIGTRLNSDNYRANLVIQTGTYAYDNYNNESEIMRLLHEANIGIALDKEKKLWLDAGVLVSHIGFESTFHIRDLTLTRSLMAESVPYYLTGAQLSYEFNQKWYLLVMVANGWQRIQRVEGNSLLSFCTQLRYRPGTNVELNWSTFVGTDDPDETRRMRYFNDVYALIDLGEDWDLQVGFDYGIQQKTKGSSDFDQWTMTSLIARYNIVSHWFINGRVEYASDKANVVISNPSTNEFETWGFSSGIDYRPLKNIIARIEGRYLISPNEIYPKAGGFVTDNFSIITSISIRFGKDFHFKSLKNKLKH